MTISKRISKLEQAAHGGTVLYFVETLAVEEETDLIVHSAAVGGTVIERQPEETQEDFKQRVNPNWRRHTYLELDSEYL